ncbi:TniB family NTP-binding protein [Rhizobium sp. GCM10022189]|uniref:TniB family NTP-binding protein n=1 Tax=Rhizobium sp. GCM10022189 TaxID=3252654 RepID=UPI00360AFCEE
MSTLDQSERLRELLRTRMDDVGLRRAELLAGLNEVYVQSDNDQELDMELDLFKSYILDPQVRDGYAVAVVGPSGAGKTTLVNQRLDSHPAFQKFDDGYGNTVQFAIRVQTPPACTPKSLGRAILGATGYDVVRTPEETDLWPLVRRRLRAKMVKVIFFDEFQHVVMAPKAKGAAHVTNTVKELMQDPEWPLWIIVAGVPDVLDVIERDQWFQMARRVRTVEIDNLANDKNDIDNTREILKALAGSCRLKLGIPAGDEFMRRLMHGGLWRFGMTIQLIKMSIEVALFDNQATGNLFVGHFERGYKRLSNCSKDSNVFVVKHWHRIQRHVTKKGRISRSFELLEEEEASE